METTQLRVSAFLMVGGLAMVVLGGYFLIGVMLFVTNFYESWDPVTSSECSPTGIMSSQQTFVKVLYTLSFTCFGVAAMLLITAVKRLIRLS
jgi:hypothetical protein